MRDEKRHRDARAAVRRIAGRKLTPGFGGR